MKKRILLSTMCILLHLTIEAQTTTKIYVLRHADRTNGDDLNSLGTIRANDLKRYLGPTRIDALFSTNTVRTKKTIKPMETLQRPIREYNTIPLLVNTIRTNWAGKRVVVVGHSDTVPQIIQRCGCVSPFPGGGIPPSQYDNLLLLLVRWTNGNPTCELLAMKYGANTP